jgi:hypothetical protein
MIKKPPSHEQLIAAIGARHDSDQVTQLLNDFGIQWNDVKLLDKDTFSHRYSSIEEGFSLIFEDIGEVFETPNHDIGDGPFLLTKITFSGYVKENPRYPHLPWKNISFDSTLEEVTAILGSPIQTISGPREPYQWLNENYKISMHWYEGPRKNRAVTYWYTPKTQA